MVRWIVAAALLSAHVALAGTKLELMRRVGAGDAPAVRTAIESKLASFAECLDPGVSEGRFTATFELSPDGKLFRTETRGQAMDAFCVDELLVRLSFPRPAVREAYTFSISSTVTAKEQKASAKKRKDDFAALCSRLTKAKGAWNEGTLDAAVAAIAPTAHGKNLDGFGRIARIGAAEKKPVLDALAKEAGVEKPCAALVSWEEVRAKGAFEAGKK